ncbi:hypothetical protein M9458_037563 [Cirrhinus mrigala]|uniref:Uncharacterized protein n=1 Tax=Cirrhinus mrigala TaxID=683832 RepID=A0ABD0NV01_CIRMR
MAYAGTIPDNSAIGGFSQTWDDASPEGFSEVTRPNGSRLLYNTVGTASHAAPPIPAQSSCPVPRQGRPPLSQGCGSLDDLSPVSNTHMVGSDLPKEGGYDGRFQLRLGRSVRGQPGIRLLDGMSPPSLGTEGTPLDTAVYVPGKWNLGADMLSRGNVAPGEWVLHPQTFQRIWGVFGKAETTLTAQCFSQCRPSVGPALISMLFPLWKNETCSTSMAYSIEEGPPLPGQWHDLASLTEVVEPSCMEPRRVLQYHFRGQGAVYEMPLWSKMDGLFQLVFSAESGPAYM